MEPIQLPDLNEYELQQNIKKPCVLRHKYVKQSFEIATHTTKKEKKWDCLEARAKQSRGRHTLTPEHLKTGFGLHAFSSLELAIKRARTPKHICLCEPCPDGQEEEAFSEEERIQEITPSYAALLAQDKLRYLMGLPSGEEDQSVESMAEIEQEKFKDEEDCLITGTSESMRRAQRYLREHKIFEFFQFLIAHLLSETPFDPVTFLINLLDKCLIYRSGICDPPLLYEKKHTECLFNLMDRMRTGFIDYDQYKTGMFTLGIKSYNIKPPMTTDGQVTKLFFIEESHECLKDLLNDMIRKRTREIKKSRKMPRAPPPSMIKSHCPSITDAKPFF